MSARRFARIALIASLVACAGTTRVRAQAAVAEEPPEHNPHAPAAPPKPISEERPDATLKPGSIRVLVVDQNDQPVTGAEIGLGTMASDGNRDSKPGKSGADGTFTYTALPTGDQKAYRVNVPFDGAKYSSSPFRLPAEAGYAVKIRRLPVTHDERMIVLYVGATSVELKDDRLKIIQQSRLLNLGGSTYVFPKGGAVVKLPAGYTGVQTQDVMGDQHMHDGEGGVHIEGSLPPGETTLLWGFDLPFSGDAASFDINLPWVTFAYRVIADAPEGLALRVNEMPDPFLERDSGRRFWITEMQRRVGDPPFRKLEIALTGIPGPGHSRFVASALALGMLIAGVMMARRGAKARPVTAGKASANGDTSAAIEALEAEARARAMQLHEERAAGSIGPEHHREQVDALVDELALALLERSDSAPKDKASAS